jgi:hypothetical protein
MQLPFYKTENLKNHLYVSTTTEQNLKPMSFVLHLSDLKVTYV